VLPPPCGTRAIDRTLTPIVAQSSLDASLIIMETLPVCGAGAGVGAVTLEPPPPQAASNAALAPSSMNLYLFVNMAGYSLTNCLD
jgi:hypothetical protein